MWLTFGGYGARTRRGAGAISWTSNDIPELTDNLLSKLVAKLPANSWALIRDETDAEKSWKSLDEIYNFFRQGKDYARNPGNDRRNPRKLGRSKWPEPDAIRLITKTNSFRHKPGQNAEKAFPRAELGLPIVTEFPGSRGDPEKTELVPHMGKDNLERWGSPIIMKPIKIGKKYKSLVICVGSHRLPKNLRLTLKGKKVTAKNLQITPKEPENFSPLNNRTSAIDALEDMFLSEKFREVK